MHDIRSRVYGVFYLNRGDQHDCEDASNGRTFCAPSLSLGMPGLAQIVAREKSDLDLTSVPFHW